MECCCGWWLSILLRRILSCATSIVVARFCLDQSYSMLLARCCFTTSIETDGDLNYSRLLTKWSATAQRSDWCVSCAATMEERYWVKFCWSFAKRKEEKTSEGAYIPLLIVACIVVGWLSAAKCWWQGGSRQLGLELTTEKHTPTLNWTSGSNIPRLFGGLWGRVRDQGE